MEGSKCYAVKYRIGVFIRRVCRRDEVNASSRSTECVLYDLPLIACVRY